MPVLFDGITNIHRLAGFNTLKKIVLAKSDARERPVSRFIHDIQLDMTILPTHKPAVSGIIYPSGKKYGIFVFRPERVKQVESANENRTDL